MCMSVQYSVESVQGYYFPSAFFETSWRWGSADLAGGLEMVPGPSRPSTYTKSTDESLLGSGKNVSHMWQPPESGVDVGIPPLLIWSVERIIQLHQIQSTHSWHTQHAARVCVCSNSELADCRFKDRICCCPECFTVCCTHPALFLCSSVVRCEKLVVGKAQRARKTWTPAVKRLAAYELLIVLV